MTEALPDADALIAEVHALAPAAIERHLREPWPIHPLRARIDDPERVAAARSALVDLDRRHADEVWRALGSRAHVTAPTRIAAREREALAAAWTRLGGDALLFHLAPAQPPPSARLHPRVRVEAPRIALDRNPGVPRAPTLAHPRSLDEVARFAVLRPLLDRCVALAQRAARALDAIGQPTHALARWAAGLVAPPERRPVWRLHAAARGDRVRDRRVILTTGQVSLDTGVRPIFRLHPSSLDLPEITGVAALAWRDARDADAIVQEHPPRRWMSHVLHLHPAVIGRRYRDLDDPFAPLLAILRLGCRLHGFSAESLTLELGPAGRPWGMHAPRS